MGSVNAKPCALATAVPAAHSCTVLYLCEVYLKSHQHVRHNVALGARNAVYTSVDLDR